MAVRTAHVALADFSEQLIAPAPCPEKSDGLDFVHSIPVVELEDKRVGLAAIDAGMRAEVVVDLAT